MSTHDSIEFPADAVPGTLPGDEADRLRELLAVAAGPASPGELAGEAAAVAAFRAARPTDTARAQTRSKPVMKSSFATRLGIKAAIATLAVTSMGGVALAATGNMPSPLPGNGKTAEERATDKAARDAERAADAAAREVEKAAKDAEKATDKAAREAAKAAEAHGFQGLCTAFAAHPAEGKGKWIDSTAFTRLRAASTAAGNTDDAAGLTAFCTTLLADAPVETPAEEPAATEAGGNGKAAANHGKGKDAEHGKDGTAPNNPENTGPTNSKGQGAERSAAAKSNGKSGLEHGNDGQDNSKDGLEHGAAGTNGQGAENGEAGQDHGRAGDAHPAAKS
jgi:hypothetical protein